MWTDEDMIKLSYLFAVNLQLQRSVAILFLLIVFAMLLNRKVWPACLPDAKHLDFSNKGEKNVQNI